jgi:PST family polysaccharide transporter
MSIQQAIDSLQLKRWVRIGLRSTVARNAASLYLIQFANYIVPLIMIPYLVRVLGPAGYGAVAFGQGLINYFMLFVEYGFDWSATRKISIHRNNPQAVNAIALCVWAAKGFLALIGFCILLTLVATVPSLKEEAPLLLILYGLVLGNALFPTWLFLGMERMWMISIINLAMRLLIAIGIFTLVRHPKDYLLYAGLTSAGSITAGVIGIAVAIAMFKLQPVSVSWNSIWEILREGGVLFLSRGSVGLYTAGNAFILGILTNHTVVGYYSAAEKIVRIIIDIFGPISQAAYPRLSKMTSKSKSEALKWCRRILVLVGSLAFIFSVILFIASPLIIRIILGYFYEPSTTILRGLAFLCLLMSTNHVLTVQVIFPFYKEKSYTLITFAAAILNFTLAIVLVPIWHGLGMALSALISEIFVTLAINLYLVAYSLHPLLGSNDGNE